MLDEDADDDSVSRSLEAYLLWLFGFVMFCNGHGNSVDRILMPYAREIADDLQEEGPMYCWGTAVLAATYRGLCDGCSKTDKEALFTGCPMFLQLWAYERLAIARPMTDHSPYEPALYGDTNTEDDRPTMGTLCLCGREVCNKVQ